MIALVSGVVTERRGDTVMVQTDGGVGYEVTLSASALDRLPPAGGRHTLFTELVVKEDDWSLYGFDTLAERDIFRQLLAASGFGPKLALALLSHLGPAGTVRGIQTKDLTALSSVSGIGRKKAERLVLELHDRFRDVAVAPSGPRSHGTDNVIGVLTGLGYTPLAAEEAVRAALADGAGDEPSALIRRALQQLAATRAGR